MATPPTITGLEPEEVQGDVMRMLPPLEKALRASAACLGKGLTLRDNVQAYLREVTFTAPDDWVPVTTFDASSGPATEFGGGFESTAYRKDEHGRVHGRGHVTIPTFGAAAILYTLPEAYRPFANAVFIYKRMDVANETALGQVRPDGSVRARLGTNGASYSVYYSYDAADRRPVPWENPLILDCPIQWVPAYVRVLSLAYAGERTRRTTGAGPVLWREVQQTRPGVRRLEIQRIMGLAPTQKYTLLLGVFPE